MKTAILLVSLVMALPALATETCTGYIDGNSPAPQNITTTCFAGQTASKITFSVDPSWGWSEAQARYTYQMASQGYQLTGTSTRMNSTTSDWYYYFSKN